MNTIFFSCLLYAHTSTHPGIQGPLAFESILILLIGLESIKVGQTPFPICPGQILNARGLIKKDQENRANAYNTQTHTHAHVYVSLGRPAAGMGYQREERACDCVLVRILRAFVSSYYVQCNK